MSGGRRLAEAIVRLAAGRHWGTVALLALLAGAASVAVTRAMDGDPRRLFDNRIGIWFLDEDPALAAYRDFQATFGNDEAILIALAAPEGDDDVFTPATLDLVARLSERLRGVEHVRGVTSLSTVLHIGETPEGGLSIDRFYESPVEGDDAARAIAEAVREDPLYRDDLLSDDGRTTLLTVQLDPVARGDDVQRSIPGAVSDLFTAAEEPAETDAEPPPGRIQDINLKRGEILDAVEGVVRETLAEADRDEDAWAWGGIGVINEALNEVSQRDLVVFSSLSVVVLLLCLWLTFRRVLAVVLALLVVDLASLLLSGLYLGLGFRFNLVTMILTTLVLVIGVTDSIYFISTYLQERGRLEGEGLSKREAIVKSVGYCFVPGFINSVTTAVAFLAFATNDMAVIRHLGVFAGIGIALAFVCTVLVCAAGFDIFDLRAPTEGGRFRLASLLPPLLRRVSGFVERRRRSILAASALLFAAAAGGILLLEVDTYTINYFYSSHRVRQDDRFITERFGPYMPLEMVVHTGEEDGAKAPDVLQAVARIEERVNGTEEQVGGSLSLAGVVARMNEVVEGDPAARRVPDRRDAIAQELIFYDPEREDDPLQLVDFPRYGKARITFRTENDSARAARRVIDRIESIAAEELPPGARLVPSGYVPLYVRLVDYLVWGQVVSISLTFALVAVLTGLLFRSVRYALLCLPPNLLPVAATLGFMGYVGIHLDVATVLIAAVALGIAVDDTIHLLYKFKSVYERTGDRVAATRGCVRTTGVPIVATSLVLTLGFAVLGLASIKSVALFGLLIGVTMLSALVGELLVTPAVLLTFGPRHVPGWIGRGL